MKHALADIVKTLVLAAALFFVVQALIQNYQVFGASMEPSVQSGDHIIVNRVAYLSLDLDRVSKFIPFYEAEEGKKVQLFGKPQRGDVVIIESPNPPPDRLIKRIVGLPGDTVEIRNGVLFVNGHQVDETYIQEFDSNFSPVVVPEERYFVLGDNRSHSNDSRYFKPCCIHRSDIVGKAWLSYWPLGDWGIVDSHPIEVPSEP
ncbi:MAG: signal peptidase I [Dehalococcoidia bacterium]